jgi:hypothetical protein
MQTKSNMALGQKDQDSGDEEGSEEEEDEDDDDEEDSPVPKPAVKKQAL